uniref:JmjC domain-containing protein n=1 Tax=Photinus pyralis TaxID=7054 RepID=A0A1Y1LYJ2_PHOPY
MAMDNKGWNASQLRNCDLQFDEIPRLHHNDPKVDELMSENKPVVVLGSNLAKSAEKWDLDYLERHMGESDFTVFQSKSHKFKYYDDKKVTSGDGFVPPTKKLDMKLPEFIKRLRAWKKGEDRLYLQQGLNNTVGPAIVHDFLNFDWNFCTGKQSKHNWGSLTSNLMLIGMEGNVTPCHYDEQENLFAQVHGFKRCILFPPDQFECLYPHPVHHPHDRQSMVDFDRPDYNKFPKFRQAKGFETVVGPGEVLYIPMYWWHHVESLMQGSYTVSVNFWYKARGALW